MKRSLMILTIGLALASGRVFAREPQAPPSPMSNGISDESSNGSPKNSVTLDKEDWGNVFIGHYGEILRLYSDWTAEAVMRGPMEVVRFHEKTIDNRKLTSPPFNPTGKDYIPENFTPLRLMQLLVIPKNAPGGHRSLKTLLAAKENELKKTGVGYEIEQAGLYPWPLDSFKVWVSTPYRLFQVYTEDRNNFFIVTTGYNPDDPILTSASEKLTSSLARHLSDYVMKAVADGMFYRDLPRAIIPGTAVCIMAGILWLLPKRLNWTQRLRRIGRMTFSLAFLLHVIGMPLLFASWRLGLDRAINDATILFSAALLLPWICRFTSVRLGGQRPWRVFIASLVANVLPLAAGFAFITDFINGVEAIEGFKNFRWLGITLSVTCVLTGVVFGLSHQIAKTARGNKAS